jgi:hypothetical protein
MGVPASEVGYASATTGRGDHEVHKGHVVPLEEKIILMTILYGLKHVGVYFNITNSDKYIVRFVGCEIINHGLKR